MIRPAFATIKLMKSTLLFALPLAIGAVIGVKQPTLLLAEPICAVEARWVKSHSDSLPSTLAELSAYPDSRRRAIWNALAIETKIALRHEQNAYYLRSGDLSAVQRAFLLDVDRQLEATIVPSAIAERKVFQARARELFGRQRAEEMFTKIGVDTPEEAVEAKPGRGPFAWPSPQTYIPECACQVYDQCGLRGACTRTIGCSANYNCGFWGTSYCDGMCFDPE